MTNNEKIDFIKVNYYNMSNTKIMDILKIKNKEFYRILKELGLKKESIIKDEFIMLSDEQKQFIIENFSFTRNEDIMNLLKITEATLYRFKVKYNLKKSKEHISKMISKRNKMVGRDHTKESLSEIALKFKSRGEFQLKDSAAYAIARKSGILDDICKHMITASYSTPQLICKFIFDRLIKLNGLYNTRKIIPPYEIDLYYEELKFAVEYNGKGWHIDNKRDAEKEIICKEKGIYLLTIIENNRKYESDIKKQIIDNIDNINEKLNIKITKEEILSIEVDNSIYDGILDKNEIIKITSKYTKLNEFRKENMNLYNKLIKLKMVDEFTSHMTKKRIRTIEEVIEEISKYTYLSDLIEKSYWCYIWVKGHKKDFLLNGMKYRQSDKLFFSDIQP
jgi:hypothetical protein